MAELKIQSQTLAANTVVCRLEGALDGEAFDNIEDEFNNLIESGVVGVLLDLSGLESFSSAGMGAILNLGQALAARGGKLVCAAARPGVLGTIEMLDIGEALALEDSVDAGRKAIAAAIKA